jgi:endonuclease YncB( thermonuclease family)
MTGEERSEEMMMMCYAAPRVTGLLIQFFFAATLAAAASQEFSGVVVGVADGDTITVLHDGVPERVRLNGVDCPERKQPFYRQAKEFTGGLAFGKTVVVRSKGRDRWKRTIGEVGLPDGRILNHELVRGGLAWWFRKYAANDTDLERFEDQAKTAKRGLWTNPNPVPPWEFRSNKAGK